MSLARFCRKPVALVLPEQSAAEAAEAMRDRHVGALVVVREDLRPVGIVTDRDIVTRVVAERKDPAAVPVADVMSRDVALARTNDRLDEAVFLMRKRGVRRLPIVDEQGCVAGVVALDDILVLLSAELDLAAAAVRENLGP
ncbi:MAG: CBS domain-containing protein [Myxococcaceae bacterium]|nr:CBS domain-containing protein [Myxococcaceae bacterium]MCI0673517.1 CBS domain-containing protein [Myxococcaceae bacterium]